MGERARTRRVWKHVIDWKRVAIERADATSRLEMPRGSGIVHVAMQHGNIALWYTFHDACADQLDTREFRVFGTGHDIPDEYQYVGTVQTLGGDLVLHVFERNTEGTDSPCYTLRTPGQD